MRGGNEAAIQHHYDVSNAFYALWLDETLTYSCALWEESDDPDDLLAAQRRKLDYHLAAARVANGGRLLDIGCGWGGLLERAVSQKRVADAIGLTLSDAQYQHVVGSASPQVTVRKESWIDHQPTAPYDSIISIGALEHFATPRDNSIEKVRLYREFFQKCRSWIQPGGAMSLQTIAYGTMRAAEGNVFISTHIFPEAELPEPHEIVEACSGLFEITLLRNDRLQYGQTCDLWYRSLHQKRDAAVAIVGEANVAHYERYLRLSSFAFRTGKIGLLRVSLLPTVTFR